LRKIFNEEKALKDLAEQSRSQSEGELIKKLREELDKAYEKIEELEYEKT